MLYVNSAFPHPIKQFVTGVLPTYLFGSLDSHTTPFLFNISQVSVASDVGTLTVQLVSGGGVSLAGTPNPTISVGAVMGVRGTTKNSGGLNTDPAVIIASTVSALTGAGTITYAATTADLSAIADVGQVVVLPYEIGDLVVSGSASDPVAMVNTPDASDNSRSFYAEALWQGTMPTTASVALEGANVNFDSRFATLQCDAGTSAGATFAGSDLLGAVVDGAATQSGAEYRFVTSRFIRAKVLGMTGGDGTTRLIVNIFG